MDFRFDMGRHVRRTLKVGGEVFDYRLYTQGDDHDLLTRGEHVENAQIKQEMNSLPRFSCDLAAMRSFARDRTDLPSAFMARLDQPADPYLGPEKVEWDLMVTKGTIRDPVSLGSRMLMRAA